MIRQLISTLIISTQLFIYVWYYKHDSVWVATHVAQSYPIYYSTFLLFGLNVINTVSGKISFLLKNFIIQQSLLFIALGLTYIVHYKGIYQLENTSRLYLSSIFVLILFFSIIYSAFTNKFYKKSK